MSSKFPPAYTFESTLSLQAMLEALTKAGALSWRMADSESQGDYLGTRLRDRHTKLRIFPTDNRYVLDIGWNAYLNDMDRDEVERIVQQDVLPVVAARNITPRESWD